MNMVENTSQELTEEFVIVNTLGLHARPAASLVQTVLKYESDIHIQMNGHRVNAKSIMGLLTLAAAQGSKVMVTCRGKDAAEALDAVRNLIESGFGEE
jgi:phosphocarrier protein